VAKTDQLDARVPALFAAERSEELLPAELDPERDQLKLLVGRRVQLLALLTAERNRRSRAPKWLRQSRARTIRALERELGAIDHEIAQRVDRSAKLKALTLQLTTRLGRVLANLLLARLPELDHLNRREICRSGRGCTLSQPEWPVARARDNLRRPGRSAQRALHGGT
jgi:transposase